MAAMGTSRFRHPAGAMAVAVLAAVTVAAGCSTKSNNGGGGGAAGAGGVKTDFGIKSKTITLGVLTDQTGPFAALGKDVVSGQQFFWSQQNAKGGVCNTYTVSLNVKNHGYNVQNAVSLYAGMKGDVLAFQQLLGSPMNTALTPQIEKDKVVTMPESWAANLTDNPYNTIVGPTYSIEMINAINYALQQKLIKDGDTVGHVYDEGEYGANGLAGAKFMASRHNFKLIEQKVKATDTDMTAAVTSLRASGVKAIFLTGTPTQTASVASVSETQNLKVPLIGSNPTFSPALLKSEAGPILKRRFYAGSPVVDFSNSAAKTLLTAYEQKFPNSNPSLGLVHGYAVANVLDQILEKACQNKDLTRAGVFTAKKSLTSLSTNGLVSPLDFSQVGVSPGKQNYIMRPIDGPGGVHAVTGLVQGADVDAFKRTA